MRCQENNLRPILWWGYGGARRSEPTSRIGLGEGHDGANVGDVGVARGVRGGGQGEAVAIRQHGSVPPGGAGEVGHRMSKKNFAANSHRWTERAQSSWATRWISRRGLPKFSNRHKCSRLPSSGVPSVFSTRNAQPIMRSDTSLG